MHSRKPLGKLSEEFLGASFGNLHLTKRLQKMAEAVMDHPSDSFPDIFNSDADLEGAYRFLGNPNVTWEKALSPHFESTTLRMKHSGTALVLHDTTDFQFSGDGDREGLGFINQTESQGFFGHFAFAVSADGSQVPLGTIGLSVLSRTGKPKRNNSSQSRLDPTKESLRWGKLVNDVEQRIAGRAEMIHVMDREADIYELLDELCAKGRRFVIRLCFDRRLSHAETFDKVSEALVGLPVFCEREVTLSRRTKYSAGRSKTRTHLARERRQAQLNFTATEVEIMRPNSVTAKYSKALKLNIVNVEELAPPEGEQKIQWKLLTTEPIETAEHVTKIVDIYRSRWVIEEYFKALKTGCNYEKRQLESLHTLLNALALFVPVAHRLLLLRTLSRTEPQISARLVLTARQIRVLSALPKLKLSQNPSVRESLLAIAQLGGHIRNNGDPGWLVIWRGYKKLLMYEIGWSAKK